MGWGVNDYPGPPPEAPVPVCPVCGAECEEVYIENYTGNVVCCDVCLEKEFWKRNAYDWMEEQAE